MIGIHSSSRLGERADHAGLRLAALAQEDHVVAGEQRVLELRQHGVLVALHAPGTAPRRTGSGRWRCAAAPPSPAPRSTPTRGAGRPWRARDAGQSRSWRPTYRRPRAPCPRPCGHLVGLRPVLSPLHGGPRGTWQAAVADDDLRRDLARRRLRRRRLGGDRGARPLALGPGVRRHRRTAAVPAGVRRHGPGRGPARPGSTFDGLFYQGDVWLDGAYLGDTEGYFFPHTFEVTDGCRRAASTTSRSR